MTGSVPTDYTVSVSDAYDSTVTTSELNDVSVSESNSTNMSSKIFERYEGSEYVSLEIHELTYWGQDMHIGCSGDNRNHTPYAISIKPFRTGSPGTCYVFLVNVDSTNHYPTGTPIASGSFDEDVLPTLETSADWVKVNISTSFEFKKNNWYGWYVSAQNGNASNYIQIKVNQHVPFDPCTGTGFMSDGLSPTTWQDSTVSSIYREYGKYSQITNIIISSGEGNVSSVSSSE